MAYNDGPGPGTFISIGMFVVMMFAFLAWGCPQYKVYEQGLEGEAELRRAEMNKRVQIEDAKAKLEAAKLLNQAEIERAKGVAEANQIIGDSLKGNDEYLKYLWINGIATADAEGSSPPTLIYVPTEAGLPILEAGRKGGP